MNSANAFDMQNSILGTDVSNALYEIVGNNNEFNSAQAQKQMDFQRRQNAIAMDFNAAEALKNRNWQEMMSNTAHQREVQDLINAGLNPVLSASGGNGASVGSGAQAVGVTSSGAKADADTSLVSGLVGLVGSAMSYNAQITAASMSAGAAIRAAEINAAAAQARLETQLDWNAAHPNNMYQLLNDVVSNLTDGKTPGGVVGTLKDLVLGGTGSSRPPAGKDFGISGSTRNFDSNVNRFFKILGQIHY